MLDQPDSTKDTALSLAAGSGNDEAVRLLVEAGANVVHNGPRACAQAANAGHTRVLRYLVSHGADVDGAVDHGFGPLETLSPKAADYRETVELLLKHSRDPNREIFPGKRRLHYAAEQGYTVLAEALIAAGADANIKDNAGQTAVDIAFHNRNYGIAARLCVAGGKPGRQSARLAGFRETLARSDRDGATAFLRCGLDIKEADGVGNSVLHTEVGYSAEIIDLLVSRGADVNAVNLQGYTPLAYAARNGLLDMVKRLVAHGARLNESTVDGKNALICAAEQARHLEIARFLLGKGAGTGPIRSGVMANSPLAAAAGAGNTELIRMLVKRGVNPDQVFDTRTHWTPLAEAILKARRDSVKTLLDSGADPNVMFHAGAEHVSPLVFARRQKQHEIAKLLEQAEGRETTVKATPDNALGDGRTAYLMNKAIAARDMAGLRQLINRKLNVNAEDLAGTTPLITAARQGNLEAITFLLDNGAKIEFNQPLLQAVQARQIEAVRFLLKRGANPDATDWTRQSALGAALRDNRLDIAELLLQHGARTEIQTGVSGGTLLIDAVKFRRAPAFRLLVKYKADINARNERGETALMSAAATGSLEFVELLLQAGAKINLSDHTGNTALYYAENGKHLGVSQLLAARGATPLIHSAGGPGMIMSAIARSELEYVQRVFKGGIDLEIRKTHGAAFLVRAVNIGNPAMVDLLLDKGADPNSRTMQGGVSVLMSAITQGNVEVIERLIRAGAQLEARDSWGRTALIHAIIAKRIEVARLLLAKGSRINVYDNENESPLTRAMSAGNVPLARLLLSAGARLDDNPEVAGKVLGRAIHSGSTEMVVLAIQAGANPNGTANVTSRPLEGALEKGNLEMARLLIEAGADVNASDDRTGSSLVRAVTRGHHDHAKFLLDEKADVEPRNHMGLTPLMIAAQNGNRELIRLLLSYKADINAGAGIPPRPHLYVVTDSDGETPLMFAAERDKDDICLLLLENGAMINARSANGGTALMSAVAAGKTKNVKLLLDNGADAALKMKNGFTALSMAELWDRTEISALLRAHTR